MKTISCREDASLHTVSSLGRRSFVKGMAALGAGTAVFPLLSSAETMAPAAVPTSGGQTSGATAGFIGDTISWHGFNRYDFIMDEHTLAITPFTAPAKEAAGNVASPPQGMRRCIVVVPRQAAPGNPWSWQGCYWDHQPQTEVELLRRGFHIAYVSADNGNLKPDKTWDAWYDYLTGQRGLSSKPAFIGMSRGGEYAYTWATGHPDKVTCIYADNPVVSRAAFERLLELVSNNVPLLQVCGSLDPFLGKNASAVENIYRQHGGRISMMVKDGFCHHPHSLRDPKPIADFIEQSFHATTPAAPAYAGSAFTRTSFFYSAENIYRNFPEDGAYITLRGPQFAPCYYRYEFGLPGAEGPVTVIAPLAAATGTPWVYRAGFVFPEASVDLALLEKGFHIVTGPVGTNVDGPVVKSWNNVYEHLTGHGFAAKPVMEGSGGGAGEVYAWAIENPDKVTCIYAENPILHSNLAKVQPLDNLSVLAKANVPLLHVCGSLDQNVKENSLEAQKRYKKFGGSLQVILKPGVGHYALAPDHVEPVVDFIMRRTTTG
jgi:pimeloyl-ACP methyl ester carboxylesterase